MIKLIINGIIVYNKNVEYDEVGGVNMKKKINKIISIVLIFVFMFSLFGIKNAFATEPTFVLENAVINDKSDKVEASIISFNNNELNTNVTFHKVDDFVSYILTIKNTTDKEYQIALINDNNSSNNVEYEYSYDNSVKIQPNKTFNVTLKATYKTSVTDMSKRDQNEGFSLSFTMVDAEGNIISDDIEVNPKTGDNIHFYIIIAVISLTGLVLIFVRNKKIKKCLVISLLLTPIVTKAVAPSFVINLNPSLKLYDKVVVVRVINGVEKEEIIDYNSVLEIPEDPNIPGYKFEGWLLDGEVYNFNTPIKEDSKLEAKLTPIEYKIEYDLDDGQVNGTNPTKYTVETDSFDLINPTKSGYVFEGWTGSNIDGLQTRVTVEKGSTGDKSFVAHFSLDEHVSYKVIHKYKKLTDGYEIVEEPLEGAAFSQVTPAFKPKEGFNNPTSGTEITILPDTLVTVEYVYERKPITLSLSGDIDKYETSISEGTYPYGTSVTLTALEQEHYNFVKWSNNSTENPLTITLTDDIDISPVFEAKKYTISFYSHGGVDVDSIQKEYNSEIGTLPGTIKTDYIFDGWYTEEVGGTKVTSTTKVTGAMELHAHWLKSVTLATVSPESVEITKGTTQSLIITNVEEEYTITSNDISVATVEGTTVTGVGAGSTTLTIKGNISKETITVNVVINAIKYDVTFNTHGGVSVNPIKVEENEEIGTLPGTTKTDYIFDGWYTEEVGGTKVTSTTKVTGAMELHAHWLKSVTLATVSPESVEITKGTTQSLTITNVEEEYTITSNDISVATVEGTTVTGVGAGSTTLTIKGNISKETKTIDVVINPSEYKVTFNSHGGDSVDYINVTPNTTIENLPITKKSGVFFGGWYTEETDGTKITTNTVITGDIELHAHWNQHLCFPAEVLHKATCSTEGGCLSAGFGNGDTITYGIKPNSLTKLPGFAYDCDINGDGNLDEANERFYYLRTDGDDDVLYYHSGFEGEIGKANSEIFVYTLALTKLPTTTQWNNVVKTFDGRAARLPKQADIENACGTTTLTNEGSLNSCYYLFETSRFESKNTGRSAIWLLNENDNYYRLHTKNRKMESKKSEATTSENAVRPTIEVPSIYIKQYTPGTDVHTVSFNAEGGTPVDDVYVDDGAVISPLPTTTRENYDFDGWYTDKTYSTKLTTLTAIVGDITYVAKWIPHVAIVNGKGYTTLSAAVSAVPKNTETTITFINDTTIESTITIPADRNIVLDIGSYTISSSSGTIFENKGILTINSGTITSTAGSGMINNNSSGTLNINGGTLSATGSRQIVYNTGGTVNIRGNAYLSSKAQEDKRGTVHNVSGTLNITGGTIVSLETNAVKVDAGTVVIGDYNGFYDTNGIIIQGKTNGISTSVNISLYDGILKGISAPINNESRITNKEEGATKVSETETIGEDTYKTLYYNLETDKYLITFIANGGTVSPTYKLVGIGSMLGELPIPSRGIYNFEGWYTDADDKVTEETVPTDNTTLTAKWSYSSNEDIVNFNTTNDVMKVYYSSIASWASEQSTFQSNMNENFYSHNCSECTGPNYQSCPTPAAEKQLCEQPKGYDTSVNSIKVYESDETTKVKGNEATYVTIVDGTLYNLIPGKTYYWESTTDSNVHGYVKATAKRRTIYSSVRNVRDLGGMEVSFTRDNQTKTGTIKYGKLFRGAQLSGGQKDVDSLLKLGITREIDLRVKTEGTNPVRLPKHDLSDSSTVTDNQDIIVTNYLIYPDTYFENYTKLRNALKATMEYIVNDNDSIYFHCTIGTDRTGTLAYFLEGFLGANREDMIEDYELSYFSGLLNRNRFHDHLDGSSINPRFTTMANTYDTNEKIYNWYMYGLSDEEIEVEDQLIQAFRDAMIDYN